MYTEFFRLNRKPFKANPKGPEVFVGPQTARIVSSMKGALAGHDAIVAVCGTAGIGKSTLVNRALDAFVTSMEVVRMPRAQLRHDEVLDFLLARMAIENPPASTIRRVLVCREALARKAQTGRGVCIVVEDADRIGEDALIEIEALTSADGTDDHGARVVLLGSGRLRELLQDPALTRLAQRTRLRFDVLPLGAGEMLAYLKHGFRLAGGDYDRLFADNVAQVLHEFSGGVPRLVNNFVEAILGAAAERKLARIDATFVAELARKHFGRQCSVPAGPAVRPAAAPKPEVQAAKPRAPAAGAKSTAPTSTAPRHPPAPVVHEQSPRIASAENAATGVAAVAPAAGKGPAIHDTLPDLAQLAPDLARPPVSGTDSAEIPTLFNSVRIETPVRRTAAPESIMPAAAPQPAAEARPADEIPAWDKDPTLAELRPDLEALERAMAESMQEPRPKAPASGDDVPEVELRDPTLAGIPAITLDIAIQQKIAEATEALKKHDATIAEEVAPDAPQKVEVAPRKADHPALKAENAARKFENPAPKAETPAPKAETPAPKAETPARKAETPARKAETPVRKSENPPRKTENPGRTAGDAARPAKATGGASQPAPAKESPADDLRRVAAGIAKAKSLEDVDDKMAETLFGEEFSAIAAAVAANAPVADLDKPPILPVELQLEVVAEDLEEQTKSVESAMEREFLEVYGADAVEVSLEGDAPRAGLDLSASQRLATVRALNAERKLSESARTRTAGANGGARSTRSIPSLSIEEQISTSMTQTLKALNSRSANDDDDDDDGDRKGGFFSRFRKH